MINLLGQKNSDKFKALPNEVQFLGSNLGLWADRYGHSWHKQPGGAILVNGQLEAWERIAEKILKEDGKTLRTEWRYDYMGLRPISAKKWSKLEPTGQRTADGEYYIEVVTRQLGCLNSCKHAFLRLIDNKGKEISVGFTAPLDSCVWQRGCLTSPDPKEAIKEDAGERATLIKITKRLYQKVIARLERDKNEGREAYNFLCHNCSSYVSTILSEELNLEINSKEYVDDAILRKIFYAIGFTQCPRFVLSVVSAVTSFFRFILTPFWLLVWLASGAAFAADDPLAQETYEKTFKDKPSLGIWDEIKAFFTLEYMNIATPWRISVWQDKIAQDYGRSAITLKKARLYELRNGIELAEIPGAAIHSAEFDSPEGHLIDNTQPQNMPVSSV